MAKWMLVEAIRNVQKPNVNAIFQPFLFKSGSNQATSPNKGI